MTAHSFLRGSDTHGPDQALAETRFNCARWPACRCPDGAVDIDCPGLDRPAARQRDLMAQFENDFLPCARWPDCNAESDHCSPSCSARPGRHESLLPEGAFAIICATAVCTALAIYAVAGIGAALIGALQ